VAGGYLLIAMVLVFAGVRAMRRIRPPERTIRTAKGNVALLKNSRSKTTAEAPHSQP
jgi:hypothetical protein